MPSFNSTPPIRRGNNFRHGKSGSSVHNIWMGMMQRTYNQSNKRFKHYGGRGIVVCERWHQFENFYADMGDPPKGLTLERKDTNGNYCPENCIWDTWKNQERNRRNNRVLTLNGESHCVAEWADILGINPKRIYGRLDDGMSDQDALEINPRIHPRTVFLTANGETHCISEWVRRLGIPLSTITNRRRRGLSDLECLGFKERVSR